MGDAASTNAVNLFQNKIIWKSEGINKNENRFNNNYLKKNIVGKTVRFKSELSSVVYTRGWADLVLQ